VRSEEKGVKKIPSPSSARAHPLCVCNPVLVLIGVLLLNACNAQLNQPVEFSGPTMGSSYAVTIPVLPGNVSRPDLKSQIEFILDEINQAMSTYLPDSELSRINGSESTDWIAVSAPLYEVLAAAQQVSQLSNGAFDITVGALVNLWGFGPDPGNQKIPETGAIQEAMQWVGYQNLELRASPASVRKHHAAIYIDLSGIASGYAADRIADLLDSKDISNYLVDISGEIRARGRNHQDQRWRIGIEKPLIDRRSVHTIIALDNSGMTTAGNYRNFFIHEGTRYSHTLDPATGWPVAHNLASVTVVHESAMIADALDTALMVMGPEQAFHFAEQHNIAALFILAVGDQFKQQYTERFAANLVK